MTGWQSVFTSDQAYKVEIVKAVLEEHGLSPVIINKRESAYNTLGHIELHVSNEEVLKALKLINNDINIK